MSEEKLYLVKNDEGKYWDFYNSGFWKPDIIDCIATPIKKQTELVIEYYGGHVVTLIEEPEKVALAKEQATLVERARDSTCPASYISGRTDCNGEESLLIKAYVNGYTVEKPKLFLVRVPHTDDSYFYKIGDEYCNAGDSYHLEGMTDKKWFTLAEIEHYGLQNCERMEVKE